MPIGFNGSQLPRWHKLTFIHVIDLLKGAISGKLGAFRKGLSGRTPWQTFP